jgi:hypothetical protein
MEAFPLHWPLGYKRTPRRIHSRFKVTMDRSQRYLHNELKRLGARNIVVSTNIPVRLDGGLYADWMNRKIEDPGVALYFSYKGKDVVMCCDTYDKIWENVYALGKAIEAIRAIDRYGVSEFMERAFTGFRELPAGDYVESKSVSCYDILGIEKNATEAEIKAAFFAKAKEAHPDKGGTPDQFDRLNKAKEEALKNL